MLSRFPARGIDRRAIVFIFAFAAFARVSLAAAPSAALGPAIAAHSPAPIETGARDVTRSAERWAATHPGTEVFFGRGDSMLPLYRDATALVVRKMDMDALRVGMTVVFIGDAGAPVAHVLIEKTPRGWIALGLGNAAPDRTPVRYRNYLGTVVAAFAPRAEAVSPAPVLAAAHSE